jgi:hypothetical protein
VTPLGHAALKLAARGLRVFPIIRGGKKPAVADNLRIAAVDEVIIRKWWNTIDWNIGVATGPGSGVWVLDLDGFEHEAWLRERETEHAPLPATVEAITARGRHLYFAWPQGAAIRNVQYRDDFPDVRAEGGYVLAPPSIHPSGRRYSWSVDSASEFAAAPQWLVDLVVKNRGVDGVALAAPPDAWRSFVDDRFDGSHRGWAIAKLAGLLLRRYLDPFVALSLCRLFNESRCAEPLDDIEVTRIVNRIAAREAERRNQGEEGDGG